LRNWHNTKGLASFRAEIFVRTPKAYRIRQEGANGNRKRASFKNGEIRRISTLQKNTILSKKAQKIRAKIPFFKIS
jgi:hypothetical protein